MSENLLILSLKYLNKRCTFSDTTNSWFCFHHLLTSHKHKKRGHRKEVHVHPKDVPILVQKTKIREKILLYEPTLKFKQTTFRLHCGNLHQVFLEKCQFTRCFLYSFSAVSFQTALSSIPLSLFIAGFFARIISASFTLRACHLLSLCTLPQRFPNRSDFCSPGHAQRRQIGHILHPAWHGADVHPEHDLFSDL